MSIPRVLSIAGSDPSGGAGIQADLKTFLACGTYGMSVITALTAQSTQGVTGIHVPPAAFLRQQFDCVTQDIPVDAIKLGVLANKDIATEVISCLQGWRTQHPDTPIVLDPVMVATSGSLLLEKEAIKCILQELCPMSTIVTPNLHEAEVILQTMGVDKLPDAQPLAHQCHLATSLAQLGTAYVLVKGGHAPMKIHELHKELEKMGLDGFKEAVDPSAVACRREHNASALLFPAQARTDMDDVALVLGASLYTQDSMDVIWMHDIHDVTFLQPLSDTYVVDVLVETQTQHMTLFIKPEVPTTATHGTGCTLSSAICAFSAKGHSMCSAVAHALWYMQHALASSLENVGQGAGPLNHGALLLERGVPLRGKNNDAPLFTTLMARSWPLWRKYTRHPFPTQIGRGTLPWKSFLWFMCQDYIYIQHYARTWSKALAKPGTTAAQAEAFVAIIQGVVQESQLHLRVCEKAGIAKETVLATPESRATMAYTRFVLDIAEEGLLPLMVSLASCAFGYAEVGRWLHAMRSQTAVEDEEKYADWVHEYAGDAYQGLVAHLLELLEDYTAQFSPTVEQMKRLQIIWDTSTRLEIGMWDEALAMGMSE
ncbi:thi21-hydroxymethylpyrimidine phosphate involved in the last steps in thiamine biosynthesis [Malassezia pachydermatis]|uniref:Thi21-hydroxymethylpyrimidine phosphate involved in the last steps in thiamine biosynthesis n=1 Tax=Malassezia pachydermatis TaxID=77020 RepID=A0A0M9VQH4_9BASI|nr:thi21-hydroxymethylpyrimidine phosphate involved in the last steps in thiamine biosynthesis [Malassezia pachydermatis]KOS15499.1 thi21-hydroxymethylpyrimidine phosphate involved in the last steps in thiamine biosynthesis [Malassezia pachydermatis]